jgi:hypothetical protein
LNDWSNGIVESVETGKVVLIKIGTAMIFLALSQRNEHYRRMPDSDPILTFEQPKGRGSELFYTLEEFESWFTTQAQWWQSLGGQQGENRESYNRWLDNRQSIR